jgi:type I restriction-modification system DNA methylase subunit
VADEARTTVTLYGQEKDSATSGLSRMNMILHNNPTALIVQGNTLADPKFKEGDTLKTFDYVVANPPFSDKRWSTGLDRDDPATQSPRREKFYLISPRPHVYGERRLRPRHRRFKRGDQARSR